MSPSKGMKTTQFSNTRLQLEIWPLHRLVPYSRSLRKNAHAVDRMAEAIEAFGFKIPILIRGNGEVVDGELRLKAAKKLGIEEVPVILCDDWSEAEVKAFRLLVNRSASWAAFDLETRGAGDQGAERSRF